MNTFTLSTDIETSVTPECKSDITLALKEFADWCPEAELIIETDVERVYTSGILTDIQINELIETVETQAYIMSIARLESNPNTLVIFSDPEGNDTEKDFQNIAVINMLEK